MQSLFWRVIYVLENELKSPAVMDEIEYMSSVTSASSLLGDTTVLPGNGSQPLELSCDEYVVYVDELLRNIAQQVSIVV